MMMTEEEKIKHLEDMFAPEDLHPDLVPWLRETSSWQVLQHPLVYSVPYFPATNRHLNMQYKHKTEAIEAAKSTNDWHRYVYLHERPYRFEKFLEISSYLRDEVAYWDLIGSIWTDSENIWQHLSTWKRLWKSNKPGREHVMNDAEKDALSLLPDMLTVYRGTSRRSAIKGLSWTLDEKRAIWFAKRLTRKDAKTYLAEGHLSKRDVLAYFDGRNEKEIVCLPEKVVDMKVSVC